MEKINNCISKGTEDSTIKILKENQTKTQNLLNEYPCIRLKTHFRGFENRLAEVIINESFLQMIGYDIDTFISTILKEGFFRYFLLLLLKNLNSIFPFQLRTNSNFIKNILEIYALNKEFYYSTPEFETQILTKSGYVRR